MAEFFKHHFRFFATAAAVAFLVAAAAVPFIPTSGWVGHDSEWYIKLAEGRIGEVIQPFASRVLFPLIAHGLDVTIFHDGTAAFLFLSAFSLLLFFLINVALLRKVLASPLLLLPLFFLPYFSEILHEFFIPDVFYLFLTALFFWFLAREWDGAALAALFFLFLARESTVLLGLVLVVVSWFRSRRSLSAAALAVVVLSLLASGAVGSLGAPNVHNLSAPIYTALKLGYNFLANIFGVRLWVTGYTFCAPSAVVNLPPLPLLGNIRAFGFCSFDIAFPVSTLPSLLSVFGIMPLLLGYVLRRRPLKEVVGRLPFWLLVALSYGALQYLVGVPSGTGVLRIVGYGWPAFLLAAPFLSERYLGVGKITLLKLSFAQLAAAWLPFLVRAAFGYPLWSTLLSLALVLLAYGYVLRLLRRQGIAPVPIAPAAATP